jgi:DNA polymerase-3 subunit epsilon
LIKVAILDTETTGTDPQFDEVIELAIILVEICPATGLAYRILGEFSEFNEPNFPIPEESTQIHHITDVMVKGKRIDAVKLAEFVAAADLVVAHNAGFDRVFIERTFPLFAKMHWACSLQQIPWAEEGIGTAKLDYLAYQFGFQYVAHRAAMDCRALSEVLQNKLPQSGQLAMQALLQNARQSDVKVSALGSPFDSKDALKARGYRWNPERKVWAINVAESKLEAESQWLKMNVYGGKSFRVEQERMTSLCRYSARAGQITTVTVTS